MHVHSLSPVLVFAFYAVAVNAASIQDHVDLPLVGRDALTIVPDGSVIAGWKYAGCFNDSIYSRDLAPDTYKTDSMTQEICIQHCDAAGYWYAGVEFGRECYCGDLIRKYGGYQGVAQAESQCNTPCAGNAKEKCGGSSLINIFTNGRKATTNPGANGFTSIGCKYDAGGNYRTLSTAANLPANNMTVAACTSACAAGGFIFAGVEYGKECWCGNSLKQGTDTYDGDNVQDNCNLPCTGNQTEWCGGPSNLNMYKRPLTLPTPSTLPPGWYSQKCYRDDPNWRTLSKLLDLPTSTMTVGTCINACAQRGYVYAGVEYGQECWCGNAVGGSGASTYADSCDMSCRGNTAETCGGRNALNLYKSANQSAINQLDNGGFEQGPEGGASSWGAYVPYYTQGKLQSTVESNGNALAGRRNVLLYESDADSGNRVLCYYSYISYLESGWYNMTFFVGRTHTPAPPTGNQQGQYYDNIRYSVALGDNYPPDWVPVCSPPSSCPFRPVSGSTNAGYDKVTYFLETGGHNRKVEICAHYNETRNNPQDGMLIDEVTVVGPL